MNCIKGTKPAGIQYKRLLYVAVNIIEYNIITIYHNIYAKTINGIVSYLPVSTYDVLNTINNYEYFQGLKLVFS